MLYFPQLSSGGLGQYPIKKASIERTIVNLCEDGHSFKLADPGASARMWQLEFADLSDVELNALQEFFISAEGRLQGFTFLDPVSNLLMWSDTLGQSVWEQSSLLEIEAGIDDPNGGVAASRLINPTGASLTLQQTVNAPGWYSYCFSVYARGSGTISLYRHAGSTSDARSYGVAGAWKRFTLSGVASTSAETLTVGVTIPAGASVDVWGLQLEAQPGASGYKRTFGVSGVYGGAHFTEDMFTFTTDAPGRHRCTVRISNR